MSHERRFILDRHIDQVVIDYLDVWAQSHGGWIIKKAIKAGDFVTPYIRVTLTYDGDEKIPEHPEYVPFTINATLNQGAYSPARGILDCAILRHHSDLPVVLAVPTVPATGSNTAEVSFMLEGSIPFWIDPHDWPLYANLISGTEGRALISGDPVFQLALELAKNDLTRSVGTSEVVDHGFNVWSVPESQLEIMKAHFAPYLKQLEHVFDASIHSDVTHDRDAAIKEVMRAFEYKPFTYEKVTFNEQSKKIEVAATVSTVDGGDEQLFLVEHGPFDRDFFNRAVYIVLEGLIPIVTIQAESKASDKYITQVYVDAVIRSSARVYLSLSLIEMISVTAINRSADDGGGMHLYEVMFPVDSAATYREIQDYVAKGHKPDITYEGLSQVGSPELVPPPASTEIVELCDEYVDLAEIDRSISEARAAEGVPGYKAVCYNVENEGIISSLFSIIVRDDQSDKVTAKVKELWSRGVFLTLWGRSFLVRTGEMSQIGIWYVPPALKAAHRGILESQNAIRALL